MIYDARVHAVWVKIFSRMLSIMVPTALAYELRTSSETQIQRADDLQESLRRRIDEITVATSTTSSSEFRDPEERPKAH
jgi:hypothetical protein